MQAAAPSPHKKARIEIIPLIDIMFFLLASFMLVSLSLVKLQGAKVDLPSAGKPLTPQTDQKPDITTITVDKDGNCLVGEAKTPVTLDKMVEWAKQLLADKGVDHKVYINGDPNINYGQIITVFDKVRRGGLVKVTLAIKPVSAALAAPGAGGAAAPGTAPAAAPGAAPAAAPPAPAAPAPAAPPPSKP